ncbi:hypothetical protein [Corynebacterium sphenisci]|uniref:hypothetical protein n=1 Tax=Corynebacterium sphenisci TaxID=191493 RepID=UPI0026DECF74|nr:hypothetical protein [Corynebacterium sphenisci]MDO5730424.1 hypothetical protein [Corynebacterium sphenisci]
MTGTGDRPGDGGDAPRWEPPQDRAWSEAEPTGQMPPQQGWAQPAADPGWTQPAAYGPGGDMPRSGSPYAAAPPQQPAPPARSGSGPVAGVLAVLAVLAIVLGAGIGYWVYRSADGGSGAAPTAAPGGDPGAGAAASSTTSSTTTTTEERPSRRDFTPDPGWEKCGGSGEPGDFNLYWAGTDVTSCPFTREVRDAFVDYYRDTGETSGTIRAKSPVTGKSYTMDCRDDGVHVTCTGGNNAVVHIS